MPTGMDPTPLQAGSLGHRRPKAGNRYSKARPGEVAEESSGKDLSAALAEFMANPRCPKKAGKTRRLKTAGGQTATGKTAGKTRTVKTAGGKTADGKTAGKAASAKKAGGKTAGGKTAGGKKVGGKPKKAGKTGDGKAKTVGKAKLVGEKARRSANAAPRPLLPVARRIVRKTTLPHLIPEAVPHATVTVRNWSGQDVIFQLRVSSLASIADCLQALADRLGVAVSECVVMDESSVPFQWQLSNMDEVVDDRFVRVRALTRGG